MFYFSLLGGGFISIVVDGYLFVCLFIVVVLCKDEGFYFLMGCC